MKVFESKTTEKRRQVPRRLQYRRAEAACLLAVSLRQLDQWVEEGLLQSKTVGKGRARFFTHSELKRFVADGKK